MRTLFLNPPSFEGFDGGAGSRWPSTREVASFWYPVWLCYPAGMLEGGHFLDDDLEHLLGQLVHVIGLRQVTAQPGADQRRVQADEPLPRGFIVPLPNCDLDSRRCLERRLDPVLGKGDARRTSPGMRPPDPSRRSRQSLRRTGCG